MLRHTLFAILEVKKMDSIVQSAFNRAFGANDKNYSPSPGVQGRIEQAERVDWEAKVSEEFDIQMHKAKIMVVGCGGAGCNTISRLAELGASGSDIIALNTDAKHLSITKAHKKLLIGKDTTKGLGAGGYPQVGEIAAIEQRTQVKQLIEGSDLVFVTAGMGGGTGTGSAPRCPVGGIPRRCA
jgi:cell division GTPase FtsZ